MSVSLVYEWRRGVLRADAAGITAFQVPVHSSRESVRVWEKAQELRPGRLTLWDHCFEIPHARSPVGSSPAGVHLSRIGVETPEAERLEVYDFPGEYAQRFDGVAKNSGGAHYHPGQIVYIAGRRTGTHLHSWPSCGRASCVLVSHGWQQLFDAIARDKEARFAIAP
jgi:hypothetical protein